MLDRVAVGRLFPAIVAIWLALAPAAYAQDPRSADWLRTVRDSALWSGAVDPSVRFTTLPVGSFLQPRGGSESGRLLVYYPGDGASRLPGLAWITAQDVGPSGPPPWIVTSELDGDRAVPLVAGELRRVTPLAPPSVSAPQVAVVDDATGLLLYGHAPHAREAPASTTKIATAIVTLEHVQSLDAVVRVSVDGFGMAAADGSSIMGLSPGQRVSIRTLLYGLLLPSGNDAAEQLALTIGESRDQFVGWMNAIASSPDELGLADTHFVNPSGLDADGHYSSAYDLAQLARRAMREDVFRDIVATPEIRSDGFLLSGHNPLIGVYPGADGVKTGSTDAAGHAIVGSAVRDGHRVYVVLMHSEDLLADASALFDWAFASFAWS